MAASVVPTLIASLQAADVSREELSEAVYRQAPDETTAALVQQFHLRQLTARRFCNLVGQHMGEPFVEDISTSLLYGKVARGAADGAQNEMADRRARSRRASEEDLDCERR